MTQMEILSEILDVLYAKSVCGLFLTEVLYEENEDDIIPVRNMEVNNKMTDRCNPRIQFTDKYIYFNLEFNFENDKDLLGFQFIYQSFLEKFTEALKTNQPIIYALTLSCYSVKDGVTYKIDAHNPIFAAKDNSTLQLVFDINNFKFGKEDIDYSSIDKELESEKELEMEEYEKECQEENPDSLV